MDISHSDVNNESSGEDEYDNNEPKSAVIDENVLNLLQSDCENFDFDGF